MNQKDDTLRKILEFNKKLNTYEYGLSRHGEKIKKQNTSGEDYDNFYHVASPAQFERQGGGICWDFATYQASKFQKDFGNVKFKTYYIVFDIPPYYPTHTFLVFHYNGKFYYFESSFVKYQGVYSSDTLTDIVNFILYNMGNYKESEDTKKVREACKTNNYRIYEYNALDSRIPGSTTSEFMNLVEKCGKRVPNRFSNKFRINKISEKILKESTRFLGMIDTSELKYLTETLMDTILDIID